MKTHFKPLAETDYSFQIVTEGGSVRLNPGSRLAFEQWQEGLMAAPALAAPSPRGNGRARSV